MFRVRRSESEVYSAPVAVLAAGGDISVPEAGDVTAVLAGGDNVSVLVPVAGDVVAVLAAGGDVSVLAPVAAGDVVAVLAAGGDVSVPEAGDVMAVLAGGGNVSVLVPVAGDVVAALAAGGDVSVLAPRWLSSRHWPPCRPTMAVWLVLALALACCSLVGARARFVRLPGPVPPRKATT
jgi:hypothetical protein